MKKSKIHKHIKNENWNAVTQSISNGCDIDSYDGDNLSVLHNALLHNAPTEIIRGLVSVHNVNLQTPVSGETALHMSVHATRWDVVRLLLDTRGVSVCACDDDRRLPLHEAMLSPAPVPTDILARLMAAPGAVNATDVWGNTPLHLALNMRRWHLVPTLVEHGADVGLPLPGVARSPLHAVCSARILPPHGLLPCLISQQNINTAAAEDDDGCTPLHLVCDHGLWSLVPTLLTHGADVNVYHVPSNDHTYSCSKTVLHKAAESTDCPLEIVEQLISRENVDLPAGCDGPTALHAAYSHENWPVLELLLRRGASVDVPDCCNASLLHTAARDQPLKCSEDVFKRLLACSKNIDMKDTLNTTPFSLTIGHERWHLVDDFLECRATVDLSLLHSFFQRRTHPKETLEKLLQHLAFPESILLRTKCDGINCRTKTDDFLITSQDVMHALYLLIRTVSVAPEIVHDPRGRGLSWSRVLRPLRDAPEAVSLARWCVIAVRRHLVVRTDAAYGQLGLPTRILNVVTLRHLAPQIISELQRS